MKPSDQIEKINFYGRRIGIGGYGGHMAWIITRLCAGFMCWAGCAAAGQLPRVVLPFGGQQIAVEVATTNKALEEGLEHRTSLPENAGMLFVLPSAALRCAWMKDTPLPLSAAFIGAGGTVLALADMVPFSLEFHCSAPSARYLLEMNHGWFARHGIGVGSSVDLRGLKKMSP